MKKLFLGLGLVALLAGCASHTSDNGMGGTSDQYNQSQSEQSTKGNSSQLNNNANQGMGTSTDPGNTTGQGMSQ